MAIKSYLQFFGKHHEVFRSGLVNPEEPSVYLVEPFRWDNPNGDRKEDPKKQWFPEWFNSELFSSETWEAAANKDKDSNEPLVVTLPIDAFDTCELNLGDDGGDEDSRPLGPDDADRGADEDGAEDDGGGGAEDGAGAPGRARRATPVLNSSLLLHWVRMGGGVFARRVRGWLASAWLLNVQCDSSEDRILDVLHRK